MVNAVKRQMEKKVKQKNRTDTNEVPSRIIFSRRTFVYLNQLTIHCTDYQDNEEDHGRFHR